MYTSHDIFRGRCEGESMSAKEVDELETSLNNMSLSSLNTSIKDSEAISLPGDSRNACRTRSSGNCAAIDICENSPLPSESDVPVCIAEPVGSLSSPTCNQSISVPSLDSDISVSTSGIVVSPSLSTLHHSAQGDNSENRGTRKEALAKQATTPSDFGIYQTKAPKEIFYKHLTKLGKDDDIDKLHKILEDLQEKINLGNSKTGTCDQILFGGDHKLANNLLKLMSQDERFKSFISVPPILHLRKSRINSFVSGYESAGILEIMQVMRNDPRQDWNALAGKNHIDMATKAIR